MNAPPEPESASPAGAPVETSVLRSVLMGAIEFYRERLSPVSGSRCGFQPSCSSFGLQVVKEKGGFVGMMMTADRLTRCNIFKGPGADYLLLPDGRLFDPVSKNILRK